MFRLLLLLTLTVAALYDDLSYSDDHGLEISRGDAEMNTLGVWNNDTFTFTVAPGSFKCRYDCVEFRDIYKALYRECQGKVPIESFAFPGGVMPGNGAFGARIGQDYFYTIDPDRYRYWAAGVWFAYTFDRNPYISKYSELWESHKGMIPLTAVEKAKTMYPGYFEPNYSDSALDLTAYAKSNYDSFWQSRYVVQVQDLQVELVDVVNGVSITYYELANPYSSETGLPNISSLLENWRTNTKNTFDDASTVSPASRFLENESTSQNTQSTDPGNLDFSESLSQSSETKLLGDLASTYSAANAALIAPFSGVFLLGLMLL